MSASDSTIESQDEAREAMCESVSPNGNKCDYVAGHSGRHAIYHMLGEEDWE